jgi:hypothetical protein
MQGIAHVGRLPMEGGLWLETNVAIAETRRRKSFIVIVEIGDGFGFKKGNIGRGW